jgi:hypothetical protein
MAINLNLEFSKRLFSRLKPGGELLVFVYDGFTLYGGLVAESAKQPRLTALAGSQRIQPQGAIDEILAGLKAQGVEHPPRRAVLASAEVVSGLLDLPVTPDKPKPAKQMHELVRWELESLSADGADFWSIGSLLEGRGLIDAQQRHQVGVELELKKDAGSQLTRFGEVAVTLGYIDREQLNETLELQERMLGLDGEMDCAWAVQSYAGDENPEGEQVHLWYGAGIHRARRRQWWEMFRRNGLQLEAIYPLNGLSAALLPPPGSDAQERESLLLELAGERLCLSRFRGAALVNLNQFRMPGSEAGVDLLSGAASELLRSTTQAVWLETEPGELEVLCKQLSDRLGLAVTPLARAEAEGADAAAQRALAPQRLAALARFESLGSASRALRIRAADPRPPLWKDTGFWRYAIPALVILGMLGNEIYTQLSLSRAKAELAELKDEKSEQSRLARQIQSVTTEQKQMQEALGQVKQESAKLAESQLREERILARNRLVPALLESLVHSMNELVVINQFGEQSRRLSVDQGFLLSGWSVNDTSAQLFSRQLERQVANLGYGVRNVKINRAIGRHGARGFGITLWVVPNATAQADETAERSS